MFAFSRSLKLAPLSVLRELNVSCLEKIAGSEESLLPVRSFLQNTQASELS